MEFNIANILNVGSLAFGTACVITGAIMWLHQEKTSKDDRVYVNTTILLAISMIILGTIGMLRGIQWILAFIKGNGTTLGNKITTVKASLFDYIFIFGLIFAGSVAYTIAAYYHLKLDDWSFTKGLLIAIPMVLIEYMFSIRGNHYAKAILNLNAIQITLLTVTFYFINAWALNYFVLKQNVIWWREMIAFVFIILAFLVTTAVK